MNWNYAPRSRWSRPWVVAGVVALAGCLLALWWRDALLTQRDKLVEQARRLPHRAAVPPRPATPPKLAALDLVFAEMRYPWTDMLDSLRAATQPGVDLLTLEPDTDIRHVRIGGLANRPQDVLDLVAALQKDPGWSSVQLVSQTRNDPTGPTPARDAVPPLPGLPGLSGTPSPALSFALRAAWARP
ncbi:PilN domain-containing protein [Burkholderia sp. BCC1977]|uniref:PilN domain-containing protein n=1 Tax=Burkholderia sp. BCC1977 TaxID=2817440 RepID=UPI002ABE12B4|nr:PilN domain-containing protein [Burkholderia sp. BCC1977]